MPSIRLTLGRKLAAAFGTIVVMFVAAIAIALSQQSGAEHAWQSAVDWRRAEVAANQQVTGTREQMAAQALYVATFDPRYKAEWLAGVALGDRGAKALDALHDSHISAISNAATAADHKHDAAVHQHLFPAVAAGDHAGAVKALRQA